MREMKVEEMTLKQTSAILLGGISNGDLDPDTRQIIRSSFTVEDAFNLCAMAGELV